MDAITFARSALFRGRVVSPAVVKPNSIIQQAHQLVHAGYKEIVLTGIHTGGYGDDMENYDLTDLLWDLDKVEGLERIRISSIEASQIDDRMLDVMKRSDKAVFVTFIFRCKRAMIRC